MIPGYYKIYLQMCLSFIAYRKILYTHIYGYVFPKTLSLYFPWARIIGFSPLAHWIYMSHQACQHVREDQLTLLSLDLLP